MIIDIRILLFVFYLLGYLSATIVADFRNTPKLPPTA